MLMRVSVGIHGANIDAAIETYNALSERYFTHASPTLFNAGPSPPPRPAPVRPPPPPCRRPRPAPAPVRTPTPVRLTALFDGWPF